MKSNRNLTSLKDLFLAAGLPGFLLFFRSILFFFVTRQRSADEYSSVDDSALLQIIFVFGIFITSVFLMSENSFKRKIIFSSPQIFLLLYIFLCFFSMIWTPNLFATGFRAFEALSYLMLISIVVNNLITRLGFQDIVEWAILWIIWEIFWSVATNTRIGGFGYLLWPFASSRLVVPMFFFFALFLTKRRYLKYIILTFSILMVSNKVFFGITFGMLGFFFGNSKYKIWLLFFGIFILATLLFVDVEELLKHTLFYGRETVSMSSTSGRDKIWAAAWEAFLQKPLLGYGYVAGEVSAVRSHFGVMMSMHNAFLSGLLGTGLVGAVLLVTYFWSSFKMATSSYFPKSKVRPVMVSTVIMSLIVSFTAPGVGGRVYGSWIAVVLIFTIISALHYQYKMNRRLKIIQKIIQNENHLDYS